MVKITFVTENYYKVKDIKNVLKDLEIDIQVDYKIEEITEIQSTMSSSVAIEKLLAVEIDGPIFVEDTSLFFNALKGLPGPYIK